jgi:hypothetical protein
MLLPYCAKNPKYRVQGLTDRVEVPEQRVQVFSGYIQTLN